ncbi:MAG TPA: HEPN domain-containing protein [Candidatus Bathyarchaeia archaeon]|nr:HEPN domain-containing protein [Candidatus Bathyarchaeia archaeon]
MTPPEEEVRRKLVSLWTDKAAQDLDAAEILMQQEPPLLYPVCFHCQQASEKLYQSVPPEMPTGPSTSNAAETAGNLNPDPVPTSSTTSRPTSKNSPNNAHKTPNRKPEKP